jgi:hypothetical protein
MSTLGLKEGLDTRTLDSVLRALLNCNPTVGTIRVIANNQMRSILFGGLGSYNMAIIQNTDNEGGKGNLKYL